MTDWQPPGVPAARDVHGLPPLVQVTSLLALSTALLLGMGAVRSSAENSPAPVLYSMAAGAAAVGVYALWRREKFGVVETAGLVVACDLGIALLSLLTHDPVGMVSNGGGFVVLGMYVAWYLPPRVARAVLWPGCLTFLTIMVVRATADVQYVALATCLEAVLVAEVMLRMRARLTRLATVDPLTGALNRWALSEIGGRAVDRARRTGEALSVVGIDLDGLKAVNDARGHLAGDALLRHVVGEWSDHLRHHDTLVRSGGDEFVVLLPGCTLDDAHQVVDRMRSSGTVAWSAGIATLKPHDTLETLVERADSRQLRDKQNRRGESETGDLQGTDVPLRDDAA